MKLESNWPLKEILLRISYILLIPQELPHSVNFWLPSEWRWFFAELCKYFHRLICVGSLDFNGLQFYGLQFFECSSYQESIMFMNFHIFCLEFKYNPSKLLKELIFPSFSSSVSQSVVVKIKTSIMKMWLK